MLLILVGVALLSPLAAYSFLTLNALALSLPNFLAFTFMYMLVSTVSFGLLVWLPLRALSYLDTIIYARTRRQLERPELTYVVQGAQRSVRLISDTLPRDVQEALSAAQARGVLVRVILAQEAFTEAVKESVALPLAMVTDRTGSGVGAFMVVDERLVITGSLLGSSGRYKDTVMYDGGSYSKRLCRACDAAFRRWRDARPRAWWER